MTVHDIMTNKVVSVTPDDSVAAAARMLSRHNIGALPVCSEGGHLRGMVTDRDIALRCVASDTDPEHTPVREIMSRGVISAAPEDEVSHAAATMAKAQIRRVPVVSSGKLVGMLSLGDLARTQNCKMEAAEALSEISTNIRRF